VAGAPLRFTEGSEDRFDHVDSRLQELEQRLLDASSRRIHDFERRLEHEWLALRQLHEEPLKTLEQKSAVVEDSLAVVREALGLLRSQLERRPPDIANDEAAHTTSSLSARPRALTIGVLCALALAAFAGYALWSLAEDFRSTAARATAAERRVSELQQTLEQHTRSTEESVQRLTAEALTSSVRAQRLSSVLAASDVRVFSLRGLRTAAAASGQVFFSPSRGVVVSVSHLPPPPADQVYQVWLVTSGGSIGLGFTTSDAQGRLDATFDIPRELAASVTGFMLSLEAKGGSGKPTGPIVIAS
jgi:Anti-sigma-K factor rskA